MRISDASVTLSLVIDVLRVLVVIFLAMHGIGHIIWFLAAWTPIAARVGDAPWSLPGNVTIRSPLGRVTGLVALATLIILVVAALVLLLGGPAWRSLTLIGIVLSFVSVAPWLRQSPGSTGYMAIAADIVLLFLLALPISVEITQAA